MHVWWWTALWVWVGEEHRIQYVPFLLEHKSLLSIHCLQVWAPVLVCYPWLMWFLHVVPGREAGAPPMGEGPSRAVCLSMSEHEVTLATLCLAGGRTVGRFLMTSNHMNQ